MSPFSALKEFARALPPFRQIVNERNQLNDELNQVRQELARLTSNMGHVPPGHFYSPIPDLDDIRRREASIFRMPDGTLPGIEINENEQLRLLDLLVPIYESMPFTAAHAPGLRYYYDNPAYSYSDAIMLHGMIRHHQPRRIIEIGSGYSSCMMLDTNERYFDNRIELTFIEPYPALLESLLMAGDRERIHILPVRLQELDLDCFDTLESGDILFIDSTHVSRIDSDVNHLFFEVLPRLKAGVLIHIHDIFYPFEYPKAWVFEGRAWNEAYLLRAFLQYNPAFRILLMNTFLMHRHQDFFQTHLPLCLRNPGGSIWLLKQGC